MVSMLDIRLLFQQLRRFWWLIMLLVAIAVAIGFLVAVKPIPYEGHATLSIEPKAKHAAEVSFKDIEIEMGRLRSWTTVERVLDAMPFYGTITPAKQESLDNYIDRVTYFLKTGKKYKELAAMPIRVEQLVFPARYHGQTLSLTVLENQHFKLFDVQGKLLLQGQAGTVIEQDGMTFLIGDISAPVGSVFHVRPYSREGMIESALSGLKIRRRTTNKYTSLIDVTFYSKDPYFATYFVQGMLDDYIHESQKRVMSSDEKSLATLTQELDGLQEALRESERELDAFRQTIDVADVSSEQRGQLELRLSHEQVLREVQSEKAQLYQIYTAQHPAIKAINIKERSIQDKLRAVDERLEALSSIQGTLLRLERAVADKKLAYDRLDTSLGELKIEASTLINPANIINKPRIVRRNLRNKALQVIALSGLMGLVMGCGFIILRTNSLSRKFVRRDQLEHYPHLTLYDLEEIERHVLISDIASELGYCVTRNKQAVLMVSSCVASEASSQLHLEIARAYAKSGNKALLIDGDLVDKHLGALVGKKYQEGFANIMAGADVSAEAVQPLVDDTLFFMAAGTLSISQVMLRDMERMLQIFNQFHSMFPCIMLDAPYYSALPQADALFGEASIVVHVLEKGVELQRVRDYMHQLDVLASLDGGVMHKVMLV